MPGTQSIHCKRHTGNTHPHTYAALERWGQRLPECFGKLREVVKHVLPPCVVPVLPCPKEALVVGVEQIRCQRDVQTSSSVRLFAGIVAAQERWATHALAPHVLYCVYAALCVFAKVFRRDVELAERHPLSRLDGNPIIN